MLRTTLRRAILTSALLIVSLPPTYAQDSSHDVAASATQDASDLAPAPSTWKGAIVDSFRLLIIEHATRIAFQDIVTPVGALGFMIAEDALDRHLITRIESWTGNRLLRALSRMALNPSRTMSNAAQGRAPWYRPVRPLSQ